MSRRPAGRCANCGRRMVYVHREGQQEALTHDDGRADCRLKASRKRTRLTAPESWQSESILVFLNGLFPPSPPPLPNMDGLFPPGGPLSPGMGVAIHHAAEEEAADLRRMVEEEAGLRARYRQ